MDLKELNIVTICTSNIQLYELHTHIEIHNIHTFLYPKCVSD